MNEQFIIPEGKIVTDSALPVSRNLEGRIITPLKDGDLERFPASMRAGLIRLSNAITSIRQAAEWGMGSIQKVYRKLLLPLPHDRYKRQLRLENIFRLFNYRVRTTKISQIRTHFYN
jgi:hypothetical protein